MKRYVIQDVNDKKFLCDDNTWSDDAGDAKFFEAIQPAWDKAMESNKENNWPLTVILIII